MEEAAPGGCDGWNAGLFHVQAGPSSLNTLLQRLGIMSVHAQITLAVQTLTFFFLFFSIFNTVCSSVISLRLSQTNQERILDVYKKID